MREGYDVAALSAAPFSHTRHAGIAMDQTTDVLYVGCGRTIIALDRFSGRPLWRRKLPRVFGGLVTILSTDREVYVGRGGYVYCFDAQSGEPLWERGLAAGSGTVMMTAPGLGADQSAAVEMVAQQQQAAAAGAAAIAASSAAAH
ncbi:MAG: PQQ-binding-like beta-propeller repeat protein [Phycisphaeraceae bacterium]|nr:PQQ-binding-like beta-propeller repeat protein [Phycisphaeraceae bacterium]